MFSVYASDVSCAIPVQNIWTFMRGIEILHLPVTLANKLKSVRGLS